jgi:hypothetical protein
MHEDDINVSSNKTISGRLLRICFAGIYKFSLAKAANFDVKLIFFLSSENYCSPPRSMSIVSVNNNNIE